MLLDWFKCNEMKSNTDKCHLIIVNNQDNDIKIGNDVITSENSVKHFGITNDNKLNFNEHVENICKKANNKLQALARIAKYLSPDKLRIVMKTFIESQLYYCPLTWMFHSRQLNSKINKLHEIALRTVHKNPNLTFRQSLILDKTHCIHTKLVPAPIQVLFTIYDNIYNLRSQRRWQSHKVRTVGVGTESFTYRGPKTWHFLPESVSKSEPFNEFKAKIKQWTPVGCTCRLCKTCHA